MSHGNLTDLSFPLDHFIQVKRELASDFKDIRKAKSHWSAIRHTLAADKQVWLDEQFKSSFESITISSSEHLENTLASLRSLVERGASARLLGNDELGPYNLAMLIKDIQAISKKESLGPAREIVRLTIVAEADLRSQKAYVGNGGATAMEWSSAYLAGGMGGLQNTDQYECCYTILSWIIEDESVRNAEHRIFATFLANLRNPPEALPWQEKSILKMICLGYSPLGSGDIYQSSSLFSNIAAINVTWLTILFPYRNEHLEEYLATLEPHVTGEMAQDLINAFTSNNKARKHFRAFFSLRPHWLLKFIIESAPGIVFSLVKRNEQDLLAPFLKNFRAAMINIKDEKGNTLLHQAVLCKSPAQNTIRLLLEANLSLQAVNNEGLSPLALALKNNKTGLAKWLDR